MGLLVNERLFFPLESVRFTERAALEIITVDRVACREQQPESDHFIEMTGSQSGTDEDRHWRKASGHFCYRLSTKDKEVKK